MVTLAGGLDPACALEHVYVQEGSMVALADGLDPAYAPHRPRTNPSRSKSEWRRNGIECRAPRGAILQYPPDTPAGV
jgi:hypothetical protein